MELPKDTQIIEVSAYWTWMGHDGIARTKVKPNSVITIVEAMENSKAVQSLDREKPFPLLIDAKQIKSMSKESRDYFSIHNRRTTINSLAILIESPVSKIIGNFFMGLNKPNVPAKLFNEEEKAINWLTQYIQN